MNIMNKEMFVVQPYLVGTRDKKGGSNDGRSLALIIPRAIAVKCNVTPNSVFRIKADPEKKIVQLSMVAVSERNDEKTTPAANVVA